MMSPSVTDLPCPDSVVWRPPTASSAARDCSRGTGSWDSSCRRRRLSPGRRDSVGEWRPPTRICRSAPEEQEGAEGGIASAAGDPSWIRPPSRAWPCPVAAEEPVTMVWLEGGAGSKFWGFGATLELQRISYWLALRFQELRSLHCN